MIFFLHIAIYLYLYKCGKNSLKHTLFHEENKTVWNWMDSRYWKRNENLPSDAAKCRWCTKRCMMWPMVVYTGCHHVWSATGWKFILPKKKRYHLNQLISFNFYPGISSYQTIQTHTFCKHWDYIQIDKSSLPLPLPLPFPFFQLLIVGDLSPSLVISDA